MPYHVSFVFRTFTDIFPCSSCGLYNVLRFHNLGQVVILIHLADTASHATVIRQRVLQHKTCHTGLAAIHQILMNSLETFFAIVIICIDDDERGLDDLLRCKHGLTSSPHGFVRPSGRVPGISLMSWKA